jgi:hypothetical protein
MLRNLAAVCLAAMASVPPVAAQPNLAGREKFSAFAIDVSNQVDITINRWSSEADWDRLMATLVEKGQDAMLSELRKLPVVGYLTTPGSLRYDLHFARQHDGEEGGRTIFLLTDRYIGSWEAANRPRTMDYPFTFINLQVDRHGRGEGDATIYTKVTATETGAIELENFTNRPVMLNDVKKVQ